jgi:hypothetical protein
VPFTRLAERTGRCLTFQGPSLATLRCADTDYELRQRRGFLPPSTLCDKDEQTSCLGWVFRPRTMLLCLRRRDAPQPSSVLPAEGAYVPLWAGVHLRCGVLCCLPYSSWMTNRRAC